MEKKEKTDWLMIKNSKAVLLKNIPLFTINDLREKIIEEYRKEVRLVSFFGQRKDNRIILYVVLADDENSRLKIAASEFQEKDSYQSISRIIPSFQLFEREFYEEFGIKPLNHPWLKPVRYGVDRVDATQTIANYPFFKMVGEELHEVGVGPIHAGIIEPGHFRFMCHGENIYHLEIQLGYQHRNIEKMFCQKSFFLIPLAESIAGDSVIAHTLAYAEAMEALTNTDVDIKALAIRGIALELERIAVHIGDLSALCGDIAYLLGNSFFQALRTLVINTTLTLCGNRFGRGLMTIGGVNYDLTPSFHEKIHKMLDKVDKDVNLMCDTMFAVPSVLSRMEQTGVVNKTTAKAIGLVGPAARASGLSRDIRVDHPSGIYGFYPIFNVTLESGDVFARAYMRYIEIKQSLDFIHKILDNFPDEALSNKTVSLFKKDSLVIAMTEGWRGEVVHCAITNNKGLIDRYKIKDPSFNNWLGLALSVRNNGISDFPLCNKSFNLSYCGYDL